MKITAHIVMASLCLMVSVPTFAKKEKKAKEEVLPQVNQVEVLQLQVDSLQKRVAELETIALPMQNDVDTALNNLFAYDLNQPLLKVDCIQIQRDVMAVENITPLLTYYNPVNLGNIQVHCRLLYALMEDALSAQEYNMMPTINYTASEYQEAIANLKNILNDRTENAIHAEELQLIYDNLYDDNVVRNECKPFIKRMKKEFALIPQQKAADLATKYISTSVEKIKAKLGWKGGETGAFPQEFVYINTLLDSMRNTLSDYEKNKAKLNTEATFSKWIDSMLNKL